MVLKRSVNGYETVATEGTEGLKNRLQGFVEVADIAVPGIRSSKRNSVNSVAKKVC